MRLRELAVRAPDRPASMPVPSAATVLPPRASSAPRCAAWSMPSARPLVTVQPAAAIAAASARAVPAPCSEALRLPTMATCGPTEPAPVADAVEDQRRVRQVQQARRVARVRQREDQAQGRAAVRVPLPEPAKRGGDALVAHRVGAGRGRGPSAAEPSTCATCAGPASRMASGGPRCSSSAAPANRADAMGVPKAQPGDEVRRWTAGNLPRIMPARVAPGAGAAGTWTVI